MCIVWQSQIKFGKSQITPLFIVFYLGWFVFILVTAVWRMEFVGMVFRVGT
jgi:hypothetical protein